MLINYTWAGYLLLVTRCFGQGTLLYVSHRLVAPPVGSPKSIDQKVAESSTTFGPPRLLNDPHYGNREFAELSTAHLRR